MAKVNGTLMLVYADGTLIAAQKGVTFTTSQNLFDTTNKESAGWAEHGNGLRSFEVTVDGLASTTGLSSEELFDYIISRKSLICVIQGTDYPYICKADVASSTIAGPMEDATTLSGTLRGTGPVYHLSGTNVQLFTDMDNVDYDTFTETGAVIASAINAAGAASALSDTFAVTSGDVVKVFVFVTSNSGQLPSIALVNSAFADISNVELLVAGVNFVTLTATDSDATSYLQIDNSGAANFSTTKFYCFKA